MKVYLEPPVVDSPSIARIATALKRYAPTHVDVVKYASQADLVVLHVIGRYEQVVEAAQKLQKRGCKYAVVQYCLKSTQRPDSKDWLWLWENAELVWSYYDLHEILVEDGLEHHDFHFMHAPLGVDTTHFYRPTSWRRQRDTLIVTNGQSRLTESVRECVMAARKHRGTVKHLGPELRYGPDVKCYQNLTDDQVGDIFRSAEFVSGLRRIEGFELPAAEGLLCGARPIMFDRAHYRHWFSEWAYFIPELDREGTLACIEMVLAERARPVTDKEWEDAAALFNWPRLVGEFWRRVR